MNIVFFGTPSFAANILKNLIDKSFNIVAIVTKIDSKYGRGKKFRQSDVKKIGIENGIQVIQPLNFNDSDFLDKLIKLKADLFVVVAFKLLPKSVWKIPINGTINLHTSLLPNYRGAAPINWVLINGENQTGLTTFFINEKIDQGEIIMQKKIVIDDNITAAELHNNFIIEGQNLIEKTIKSIENKIFIRKSQNISSSFSLAPKLKKDLFKINWNNTSKNIHNLVRGLSPLLSNGNLLSDVSICPSAWFYLDDNNGNTKRIKLLKSEVIDIPSTQSKIQTDNKSYLYIHTNDGAISILYLQPAGKKPMTIKDFLLGNKIENHFNVS